MHEMELLRVPLAFGRAHGNITLSENGAVATKGLGGGWRAAASTAVMRSGRHFAQFTMVEGIAMFFGVIRPGWDVEGGGDAEEVDGHCFYDTFSGSRWPGNWEGMQPARQQGDRIGMLLDLDQGSMTVWKNGEQLGVMQAEGLTGPLCWGSRCIVRARAHASTPHRRPRRRRRGSWRRRRRGSKLMDNEKASLYSYFPYASTMLACTASSVSFVTTPRTIAPSNQVPGVNSPEAYNQPRN
jgi:hypothetical protein